MPTRFAASPASTASPRCSESITPYSAPISSRIAPPPMSDADSVPFCERAIAVISVLLLQRPPLLNLPLGLDRQPDGVPRDARDRRRTRAAGRADRLDESSQLDDRRLLEDVPQREVGIEGVVDAGDDLRRQQRMAAER